MKYLYRYDIWILFEISNYIFIEFNNKNLYRINYWYPNIILDLLVSQ